MRRLAALALVVAACTAAGAARADTSFSVVAGVFTLPSAEFPNTADPVLPPNWTSAPAQPEQLSYDQLLFVWKQAGTAYGVPWNVLAAINKIESNFGRNMGPSSAGAIGWMQFMPSTWLRWGTDADGNGIADPWSAVDAIYSAARYLAASGASTDIRQAVFSYNHAWWYVDDVMQLAQLYGSSDTASPSTTAADTVAAQVGDGKVVFALDQLQAKLDDAKAAVTQASAAYSAAAAKAAELAGTEQAFTDQSNSAPLLSDRLDAQMSAAQAAVDADAAQAEADRLKGELDQAQSTLDDLQQQAQAAAFNQPARQVLSAAPAPVQASGAYVFPVGGGPSVVSVSHTHHDYPAADIAAPEGTPLYALTDGTVEYAWQDDARCGTGFTMKAADGQVWTYCHMSYEYPEVVPGAALTAGQPVGLVGHTGHATGPHLHLQLQPATSYPQAQSWFQSFAGTAFSWSDEAPTKADSNPTRKIVFDIVQAPSD
jgi:murein DD-endopeptidase MepM/ murein hydrolase activator NlpD